MNQRAQELQLERLFSSARRSGDTCPEWPHEWIREPGEKRREPGDRALKQEQDDGCSGEPDDRAAEDVARIVDARKDA